MKNTDNIEKLFKETFDHFEADVNPKLWSHIQNGINSFPTGTGGIAAKFTIAKIIAGVASVTLGVGGVWYFAASDQKIDSLSDNTQNQTAISKEIAPNTISKNIPANSLSEIQTNTQIPYTTHSLNNNTITYSPQIQIVSGNTNNTDTADNSAAKNSPGISGKTEQPKYGKSPAGPSPLIRGNQKSSAAPQSKVNSTSDNQNADQSPSATIITSAESGDAPLTVQLRNLGIASALHWDFGDGSFSKEQAPTHTFKKPGNYQVMLTAKNSTDEAASDKINIEVRAVSGFEHMPNVFSPNGDGANDFFYLGFKNIASIEVIISDINGGFINKWNTLDGSWDGKLMNGDNAPEGVYFYSIHAVGTDGVIHSPKGSITLNRKAPQ